MAALRDPGAGCPWDIEQTFASIAPYTIEEAYEVADAIERGSTSTTCGRNSATSCCRSSFTRGWRKRRALFDFGGVVEAITAKLIRRHPHVFGDADARTPDAVKALGDGSRPRRSAQRAEAARPPARPPSADGALDGVPLALPALTRALKLQEKAGKVGFDWNDVARGARQAPRGDRRGRGGDRDRFDAKRSSDEVGDLLFAVGQSGAPSRTSIPRPRCAAPTPSSSAASPISRAASPSAGGRPKTPPSTRWRRCGSRRRPRVRAALTGDPSSALETARWRARIQLRKCRNHRSTAGPHSRARRRLLGEASLDALDLVGRDAHRQMQIRSSSRRLMTSACS